MGIKFSGDNNGADASFGGGLNASWSKSFTDIHQAFPSGVYYAASGHAGYQPTLEMPFYYSFTVQPRNNPDSGSYDSDGGNRYYPVSFRTGTVRRAASKPNLVIYRGYNLPGPHQFESTNSVDIGWTGSSTHQGGMYAAYYTGDSAWSDMNESSLARHRRTYHTVISSHSMKLSYSADRGAGPFEIMLRGGFQYWCNATYPALPTQVTAGGSVFSYGGNDSYQTWSASTTSVSNTNYNGNVMGEA